MGIDIVGFHASIKGIKYCKKRDSLLTLGRQETHLSIDIANHILNQYTGCGKIYDETIFKYCEKLYQVIGFKSIESLDNSSYEKATYVHDMNLPIPSDFKKYDCIIDGGTIEHVFNQAQVLENIINMLEINGIFISITCNNNYSGHGFYQFSPDFFLSTFKEKYGMEVLELYLAKLNTEPNQWIDIRNINPTGNGRNNSSFDTKDQVYILCIARKKTNERQSLITCPPQQFSYENIDWQKNKY